MTARMASAMLALRAARNQLPLGLGEQAAAGQADGSRDQSPPGCTAALATDWLAADPESPRAPGASSSVCGSGAVTTRDVERISSFEVRR